MATPNIYWAGTPNYTSGNYGIVALFPHWTCGGFDGSVATLQNPSRQASAHYVIEGGKVAQLVSENDSAWHCGNYYYNMRSISYELVGWSGHPPTYETLDTCARMMAQASRKYFGGAKLVLGDNVYLHKWVSDTDCPGETDIDWLVSKANSYLGKDDDDMTDDQINKLAKAIYNEFSEPIGDDKKAQWGPTGKGTGKSYRNGYNLKRWYYDLLVSINSNLAKIVKKLGA